MTLLDAATWTGKIFLDGWTDGGGGTARAIEPATGDTLGEYGVASVDDVRRAAGVAARAQQAWAQTKPEERAAVLRRAGQLSDEANAPFGGTKSSGNGSRIGGAQANIESFTEIQWLTMRPEIAPYPF